MLVAVDLDDGVIPWSVPTGEEKGIHGLFPFGPALDDGGGARVPRRHAGSPPAHPRREDGCRRPPDPAAGWAPFGPISYRIGDGPQWIAVAAGGHPALGSKLGDYVIAYRLGNGPSSHDEYR
jgi:quinoprotein glucose dehydrogenase